MIRSLGLALLACVMFSSDAFAGTITIRCTAPTQNEDGTPLMDLAGYRFYYGTTQGGPYPKVKERNATACAYVIDNLTPAIYYIVATAINTASVESRFSNEATKEVLSGPTAPGPPINLIVEPGSLAAYGLSQTRDTIRAYPIGTVPAGTTCDSTMRFNDKYVVPFEAVQWVGTARPETVFAACGAG